MLDSQPPEQRSRTMASRLTDRVRHGFFVLDLSHFLRIGTLDLGVEEAATYLCLLAGTEQTNTRSSWGVKSVMDNSGLTRSETRRAIANLEKHDLLKPLAVPRKRARTIPRYEFPLYEPRQTLSGKEREAFEAVQAGVEPDRQAAQRARRKGWLVKDADGWKVLPSPRETALIPNTFVRVPQGPSPVARLLRCGELDAFMLAAELYAKHDLLNEGGVPLSILQSYYSPVDVIQVGHMKIVSLECGRTWEESSFASSGDPSAFRTQGFWDALHILEQCHIVEWSIYSANGKPRHQYDQGRPSHPLGVLKNGRQRLNQPESAPSFLAYLIGVASVGETPTCENTALERWRRKETLTAIEHASVPHVEGVGVLRMSHRADTEATRVWFGESVRKCRDLFFSYMDIIREHFPQYVGIERKICDLTCPEGSYINNCSISPQREFKVISTQYQT